MTYWYASTDLHLMAAPAVAKTLRALTGGKLEGELSVDSSG
jgi:hypothetical protein